MRSTTRYFNVERSMFQNKPLLFTRAINIAASPRIGLGDGEFINLQEVIAIYEVSQTTQLTMVFVHFNKIFIVDLSLLLIIAYGNSREKRLVVVCVPASDCM